MPNLYDLLFMARMLGGVTLEREVRSLTTDRKRTFVLEVMSDPIANTRAQARIESLLDMLPSEG